MTKSLLFDDLVHQEGCYGASYAAIPHLLKIAEPEESRRQRWEIAFFVGSRFARANQGPHVRPGELQLVEKEPTPGIKLKTPATDGFHSWDDDLSIGFNDQCDVIVALAMLGAGDPDVLEPAVLAFLNSERVQRWVRWLLS
jgi:hypothetical protein